MAQFEKLSFQELARFAQLPQDEYARQICNQRKVEESSVFGMCLHDDVLAMGTTFDQIFRLDMHGRPIGEPQPSQLGRVYALAVAGDKQKPILCAGGDKGVAFSNWSDGSHCRLHQSPATQYPDGSFPPPPECNALVVEAGGSTVLCGDGDGRIRRRDIETGKVMDEVQAHSDMILALCHASEAHVTASCSEDGTCKLLDLRDSAKVVKEIPGVDDALRKACKDLPDEKHWCGAVHIDSHANWISLAGGFQECESGGWFCTRYAQTGEIVRSYKSTASVRCLEADERNNELLMASDCAFVTGWNLRDPHADKSKPRFRRKIDGLPAVYTLIAADAPAALAQNADNDLAMSDDDFGADRVLISAGAAPHAVVTAKDRVLAYLQLPVPDIKPPV